MPLILGNKVEVVSPNSDCSSHFSAFNSASQNTPSDGNITSKGTFLVNVMSWIKENTAEVLRQSLTEYNRIAG